MSTTHLDRAIYQELSTYAGDVFYVILTSPDPAIEYVSETIENIMGMPGAELIAGGTDLLVQMVDERDREELLAGLAIAPDIPGYAELRWAHPDGHTVFAQHWFRKRRREDGSEVVEGFTREVTGLRRLEGALRESEDRFRLAMQNSAVGLCLVSPAGQFLDVNDAMCDFVGRDKVTLLHTTWQNLTHPGDLRSDVTLVDEVLRGDRENYRFQKRYLRPDNSVVWGDLSVACVRDEGGRVRYFVCQVIDVTQQMQIEEALRASEEQYRLLAEESSDFIVRTDLPSRKITFVSPSVTKITGWRPEDLIGKPATAFVHPEDLIADPDPSLTPGIVPISGHSRLLMRDGTYRWVHQAIRTLHDEDGRAIGRIGSVKDIDAQVKAEHALARSEAAARRERERLQTILDGMLDPHFVMAPIRDDAGRITDFRIAQANEAATRITDRLDLVADTVLTLAPGQQDLVAAYTAVLQTGEPLIVDGLLFTDPWSGEVERRFDLRAVRIGDEISVTIRDSTQREAHARALAESQERYRLLAENATDIIFRLDIDGNVEWVSEGVTAVLGAEPAAYVGVDMIDLVYPPDRAAARDYFHEAREGQRTGLRLRLADAQAAPHWVEASIRMVTGLDGVRHFAGGCREITAEVEALAELDRRARTDHLTGLYNRDEAFSRLAAMLTGDLSAFAVAFCDVDAFKLVNDTYGHAVGDTLLVGVAERIRGMLREGDMVARMGGDEMLVVLRQVGDLERAIQVAEKLRISVQAPFATDAGPLQSTMSVGVTLAQPGEDAEDLIARADLAMYQAKQGGRDRVVAI